MITEQIWQGISAAIDRGENVTKIVVDEDTYGGLIEEINAPPGAHVVLYGVTVEVEHDCYLHYG